MFILNKLFLVNGKLVFYVFFFFFNGGLFFRESRPRDPCGFTNCKLIRRVYLFEYSFFFKHSLIYISILLNSFMCFYTPRTIILCKICMYDESDGSTVYYV